MKVIIDSDYSQYRPLFQLTEVNLFEVNLRKYKRCYIFIDSVRAFRRLYRLFPDNCMFLIDRNIRIGVDEAEVELRNCPFNSEYSFKEKIIRRRYIKNYV